MLFCKMVTCGNLFQYFNIVSIYVLSIPILLNDLLLRKQSKWDENDGFDYK